MADYNRWMNTKLCEAAGQLSDEHLGQTAAPSSGRSTKRCPLAEADTIWLLRFAQHPARGWLQETMPDFPQPTSLRRPLTATFAELRDDCNRLDAVIVPLTQHSVTISRPFKSRLNAPRDGSRSLSTVVAMEESKTAHLAGRHRQDTPQVWPDESGS